MKNIFADLEELISEASRYNTEVISETTKFLTNMDRSKLNRQYFNNLSEGLFSDALQKIVTLNVNYAKELMKMGIELSKKLNETTDEVPVTSPVTKPPARSSVSAFKLETSAIQGAEATTAFLLNSDKQDSILCKVQNATFQLASDETVITDFKTEYSPQLFELVKGIAQRVDVKINIPADAQEGIYTSRITVAGFEYTHFDLIVEVLKKKTTPKKKVVASTEPKVTAVKPTKKAPTTRKKTTATAKATATKAKAAPKATTRKTATVSKATVSKGAVKKTTTTRKKATPKKD